MGFGTYFELHLMTGRLSRVRRILCKNGFRVKNKIYTKSVFEEKRLILVKNSKREEKKVKTIYWQLSHRILSKALKIEDFLFAEFVIGL